MKSVHEGDTLVVWKLDRLAPSARQLIDTVDALRERGAEVVVTSTWIGAARGLEGPLTSGRGGGSPRPERFVS